MGGQKQYLSEFWKSSTGLGPGAYRNDVLNRVGKWSGRLAQQGDHGKTYTGYLNESNARTILALKVAVIDFVRRRNMTRIK